MMSVTLELITAAPMLLVLTLMVVMTVPAKMDTLEMALSVKVFYLWNYTWTYSSSHPCRMIYNYKLWYVKT